MKSLNLVLGKVETEAIEERHFAAHGKVYEDHDGTYLVQQTLAYRTLIYRILIAACGLEHYIDYSVIPNEQGDYPERSIQERLMGPANDGNPQKKTKGKT